MSILITEQEVWKMTVGKQIAKAAAIHAVQYLEEPCTEHPQRDDRDFSWFWQHRYLCPDCMANIKKELGI